MRHQLHMIPDIRDYFIERHDFYVAQVKQRVLSNFVDIEGQTDKFAEAEFERLKSLPVRYELEEVDLAETAMDHAHGFYALLGDLHRDTLLSALAGCFHQWDKELREFLERELVHTINRAEAVKFAWNPNPTVIFDILGEFGWDVRASEPFSLLEAGRLLVNVYKHGNGRSLNDLATKYPKYVHDPAPGFTLRDGSQFLDHTWVRISEPEFDEIATYGIRQFWLDFPEISYADP